MPNSPSSLAERLRAASDKASRATGNGAAAYASQAKAQEKVQAHQDVDIAQRTGDELKIKDNPFYKVLTDAQSTQEDKISQVADALDPKKQPMEKVRANFKAFQEYYTFTQSEDLDEAVDNIRRLMKELENNTKVEVAEILKSLKGMLDDVKQSRDLVEALRQSRLTGKTIEELSAAVDRNAEIVKRLGELDAKGKDAAARAATARSVVDARIAERDAEFEETAQPRRRHLQEGHPPRRQDRGGRQRRAGPRQERRRHRRPSRAAQRGAQQGPGVRPAHHPAQPRRGRRQPVGAPRPRRPQRHRHHPGRAEVRAPADAAGAVQRGGDGQGLPPRRRQADHADDAEVGPLRGVAQHERVQGGPGAEEIAADGEIVPVRFDLDVNWYFFFFRDALRPDLAASKMDSQSQYGVRCDFEATGIYTRLPRYWRLWFVKWIDLRAEIVDVIKCDEVTAMPAAFGRR